MYFSVKFRCERDGVLFEWQGPKDGLEFLDYARSVIEAPLAAPKRISNNLEYLSKSNLVIEVSESQARDCPHFWQDSAVTVWVSHNGFQVLPYSVVASEFDFEWTLRVKFESNDVWRKWAEAGYPLQWSLE